MTSLDPPACPRERLRPTERAGRDGESLEASLLSSFRVHCRRGTPSAIHQDNKLWSTLTHHKSCPNMTKIVACVGHRIELGGFSLLLIYKNNESIYGKKSHYGSPRLHSPLRLMVMILYFFYDQFLRSSQYFCLTSRTGISRYCKNYCKGMKTYCEITKHLL